MTTSVTMKTRQPRATCRPGHTPHNSFVQFLPYFYHILLWGCRVYWQHLGHAAHWLSLTHQKLRTDDNFLQRPQWPPGRVPLINGGGEGQIHSNSDGVPNVPKRRNSTQCITNWIGEQDNPQTTVTCSPQPKIPSQHLETSQATPFHSL